MKPALVAVLLAALLLFGCTQQNGQSSTTGSTAQEINTIEGELSGYDAEFTEIEEMLNDPELESMEFVELDESAFQ